jgi:hypothetical protein
VTIPLEFQDIFSGLDDDPPSDLPSTEDGGCDVEDPIGKFFQDAECGALLNLGIYGAEHVEHLRAETKKLDSHVVGIYKALAQNAEAKSAPATKPNTKLEKRKVVAGDPNDTRRVLRTETTKYSSGKVLIAEIAETGEVIRVIEDEA